jgi:hypothetical protein
MPKGVEVQVLSWAQNKQEKQKDGVAWSDVVFDGQGNDF